MYFFLVYELTEDSAIWLLQLNILSYNSKLKSWKQHTFLLMMGNITNVRIGNLLKHNAAEKDARKYSC